MSSPSRSARLRLGLSVALALGAAWGLARAQRMLDSRPPGPPPVASRTEFRVCSDPNNLPFSNGRGAGFENKLAEMVARDLGRPLHYTWWPQRRGFMNQTLLGGKCDVVIGVPAGYDLTATTRPYYRSTYVFVTRRDRRLGLRSLDDPMLRRLSIGVHVIGADYASLPPVQALAHRGIVRNLRGYIIYGDYSKANPPAALIDAVAAGKVDVAIAWGPLAGYFAQREKRALSVVPVSPQIDVPFLPLVFDIAMGVRRQDTWLRDELDREIERRQPEIRRLLERYGVPLVNSVPGAAPAGLASSR